MGFGGRVALRRLLRTVMPRLAVDVAVDVAVNVAVDAAVGFALGFSVGIAVRFTVDIVVACRDPYRETCTMVLSWTAMARPTAHAMATTTARAVPAPWPMSTRRPCRGTPWYTIASLTAVPRLLTGCHGQFLVCK